MKEINVAIIGCGRISGHHCEAIRSTEGMKIVAVCDLEIEKAEDYSKKYNARPYSNYHTMLKNQAEIDVVVVATPSGMHFEHSMEVIEKYNKSIIVEKPTFMKPSQVTKAFAAAKSRGLNIFPIFQNRYNSAVQRVKNSLLNEELGSAHIFSVRVRWCRPQRYYDLAPWRGTFSQDGGALSNQGIHHVDLLRYLGGEVEEVTSILRTFGANIEVEDTAVASLKFKNGAIGTLEITTAARPDDFEASISIVGSKGLAQIGGKAVNALEIFTPSPDDCAKFSEDFTGSVYGNGHKYLYQSISDYYHRGIPYLIEENDCLNSLKLLHSFYVSNETGKSYNLSENKESERLGEFNESLFNLYRTKE
jgi:UDP-N-acetyl-2-amino-2-deoxyglucuronate dehydrogenase